MRIHSPDAPAELERVIRKALAKKRDERYQSARDFLGDLSKLKLDLELENRQPSSGRTDPEPDGATAAASRKTKFQERRRVGGPA